jgi:hypothetical protein
MSHWHQDRLFLILEYLQTNNLVCKIICRQIILSARSLVSSYYFS